MILSHRREFIFFAADKTATTSIRYALRRFNESRSKQLPGGKHTPPVVFRRAKRLSDEQWQRYFKFAFVRNPWDWVIATYFWHKRHTDLPTRLEKFEEEHFLEHLEIMKRFEREHGFERTQLGWLSDEQGDVLVDFVGRFERLHEDFAIACDRIGLRYVRGHPVVDRLVARPQGRRLFDSVCGALGLDTVVLPHAKKGLHRHYGGYYTDATRQMVADTYKRDIEAFGYAFE